MEKNQKPIPFEQLYPDYPIKKVNKLAYIPGIIGGISAMIGLFGLFLGTFYVLSDIKIPVPVAPAPPKPQTEEQMMLSLPVEKLYEIAVNCMSVKDADCAKKVFSHIMKIKPDFIEGSSKRRKLMSAASAL